MSAESDPGFDPDFRIHPDPDSDVCRITPKMFSIHYLVAKFRKNQRVTV